MSNHGNISDEIQNNSTHIRSDYYTMSIGEVMNMYADKEIVIRPEFQRLFRWSIEKKSRLIESILLGIPIPPVFVSTAEDGTWEVVDGLQRLSTILQFVNELRNEETGDLIDSEPLLATRYLPSLQGVTWENGSNSLPRDVRIAFKRSRIDLRILLRESDDHVKYELFDRLNSGGDPTSPQEVRSAILLMENADFYRWIDGLIKLSKFDHCLPLTTRQENEQYDLELVVRFLTLYFGDGKKLKKYSDMDEILTESILELARDQSFDKSRVEANFVSMFDVFSAVGQDVFRRYSKKKGRPLGAFSVSTYEAATQGVYSNLEKWKEVPSEELEKEILSCLAKLAEDGSYQTYSGAGVRATQRIPHMKEIGARIFKP